ncbi:MAG: DNA-binding response regulator [Planctomycetota bacterium]|nr:MAG: DNA-binding response regulator [Planctomycetota bacterium]
MVANNEQQTVFLVDDCPLLLEALANNFNREPEFTVIGTASDSDDGFRKILDCAPDLVLCDVELPGRGAFTMAEEVLSRLPLLRLVFLTDYVTDVFLDQTLRVNATGYLLKTEHPSDIVKAVRSAMRGERCFSNDVLDRLDYHPASKRYMVRSTSYLSSLTNRQLEVLRHLTRGESVKEVARAMMLSERAIESHKYRIMQKLGIHDRVERARYAIREGLTVP